MPDPPDLVQITSPSGVKFTVAKEAADAFSGFLSDLESGGYKINQAESGGYANRNIAGTNIPSQHAFGRAIDVNWQDNPRGANTPSNLPPNVGDIAASHGLVWGGNWSGDTRDPMHFELGGKPVQVASNDDLMARMQRLAPAEAPQTATDATPAGSAQGAPQGAVPSSDDLLARMNAIAPPAPEAKPAEKPQDVMIDPTTGAPMMTTASPPVSLPSASDVDTAVRNALAPAPNTIYGDVLPLARDTQTGELRFAMPNMLRAPLLGLTGEGPQIDPKTGSLTVPGATINPSTGALGVTPEAASVAPFAAGIGDVQFSGANPLQFVPPSGTFDRTAPLSPEFKANPLTPGGRVAAVVEGSAPAEGPTAPTGIRVTAPKPLPAEASAAAPQAAGAQATPSGASGFTPAEEAAYRATAEGQKYLERQEPGVPDRNSYVPDVTPNAAEQEQTVTMARELKSLGIASTEASEDAKAAAFANNEARQRYFEQTAKSPVDVANAQAARDAQAQEDLKATWANKTDADVSPVVDVANQIKASPDGRRPAVRNAVDSVTNELTDANGNLLTDPEQLYGVRKHLDDLLSKEGQRETPLSARATASLQALKEQLDTTIEAAAPGFKQYLQNFSDASRKIDEMQVLQGHEKGLYDGQGRMQYGNVQRMMRNIVDSRNSPGLNPYKSITDDTMQRLWNLRDDLRRSSSALELARAPGSDTASNAVDLAKQYAKMGGQAAVMGIAHAIAPIAGPVAVRGFQAAAAPIRAARIARQQAQRAHQLLYPSNPLTPP